MRKGWFFLLLLLAIIPSRLAAQWALLNGFPAGVSCVYFLDKQGHDEIGFVGLMNGEVYRTTDRAQSWTKIPISAIGKVAITAFAFKDNSIGWLTCRQPKGQACFRTTDGGLTWTAQISNADLFCVYFNSGLNLALVSGANYRLSYTGDYGANWVGISSKMMNGIAISNGLNGVATCLTGNALYTKNGGQSWLTSNFHAECWNPVAVENPSTYFAIAEGAGIVFRTRDSGATWTTQGSLPRQKCTGDIRGTCDQLYAQADTGVYYSVDEGVNWHPLGGPGNQPDTRFYVIGNKIYAGNIDGQLWLYVDTYHAPEGRLRFTGAFPNIVTQGCNGIDTTVLIWSTSGCRKTELLSFTCDTTPGITILHDTGRRDVTPYAYSNSDTDFRRIKIRYRPVGTNDSAVFHFHYRLDAFEFDTTVVLHIQRDVSTAIHFNKSDVALVAKNACQEVTGTFAVLNSKCDTVLIESIVPHDSLHFRVLNPRLPAKINPNGSLTITVAASDRTRGTLSTLFDVVASIGGVSKTFSISATLEVQQYGPISIAVPVSTRVAPTNICARRRAVIPIQNKSCDTTVCEAPRWIIPVSELSIVQQPSFPDTLAPGARDSIVVEYAPTVVRNQTALLGWLIHSPFREIDTQIQVRATSYSLSRATLPDSLMQFDSLLQCDARERTTFIYNESCQRTQITEVRNPADGSFVTISPVLGIWIAAGDSLEAHVRLAPKSSGAKIDSVQVFLTDEFGSQQELTVLLRGYAIADVPVTSIEPSLIQLSNLDPCSTHDTTIRITNHSLCDSVTISSASFSGSPWFSVNMPQPIRLATGQDTTLTIHIATNSDSSASGQLRIVGSGFDSIIYLTATTAAIKGDEVVARYTDSIFHAKLCGSDRRSFWIRNRTCGPIQLSELHLLDSTAFALLSRPSLLLAASDSIQIDVAYIADDTLPHSSALHYATSDGKIARTIPLTGVTTTVPQHVRLTIVANDNSTGLTGSIIEPVDCRIVVLDEVPDSLGLNTIEVGIAYNSDLLSLASATALSGWNVSTRTVTFGSSVQFSGHSISKGEAVARLEFVPHLTKTDRTSIALLGAEVNSNDSLYKRCVLSASSQGEVNYMLEPTCGDSLLRLVLTKTPLSIERANYLTASATLSASIFVGEGTTVRTSVVNERGVVTDLGTSVMQPGRQQIALPCHLSNGLYFLVLASDRNRVWKSVVVTQ